MADKKEEGSPKLTFLPGSENVYFSNIVRVASNELEFRLSFCLRGDDQEDLKCQFQVSLPPKVAGSIGAILLNHLANYERKYKTRLLPQSIQYEEQVGEPSKDEGK